MNDFLIAFVMVVFAITIYSWGRSDGEYKTFKYFMEWMEDNEE